MIPDAEPTIDVNGVRISWDTARRSVCPHLLPLNLQPHLFLFLDLGRQGADAAGHGQHGDEGQRVPP